MYEYAASVGMKVLSAAKDSRTSSIGPSNLTQLDPTRPSGIACSGDRPDLLCYTLAGAWPVSCPENVADYGRCVDYICICVYMYI